MYTRVGLKRPLVRFCARLTSFLFSDPRRATRNKRRVGNQIGAHPFLHHHLVSAFGPDLNYDQLSLLDGRYATVVITLPFMTYPMAAGLTGFFSWETKVFAWAPDFTSGVSLSRCLSSPDILASLNMFLTSQITRSPTAGSVTICLPQNTLQHPPRLISVR
jgi:hypothetical protein